jgi:hypothetical protein
MHGSDLRTAEVSLVLDGTWPPDGMGAVRVVLAQLPDPATLLPGTRVVVHASHVRRSNPLLRWILRPRQAHVAIRCTALLARGYRDVCVERDPHGEILACGTAVVQVLEAP